LTPTIAYFGVIHFGRTLDAPAEGPNVVARWQKRTMVGPVAIVIKQA
jgi:hypothetical protein